MVLVHEDLLDPQDQEEELVDLAVPVHVEQMDSLDQMEVQAHQEVPGFPALQEIEVVQAPLDLQVLQGSHPEQMDDLAHPAYQDQMENREHQDSLALLDSLAVKATQDKQGLLAG